MRRRDFMTVLTGAAAWPLAARAQQKPMPVIGYFSNRSPEAETPLRTGFLGGLERAGFVIGRDVVIEYRFAEGRSDRLPSLAAELIRLPAAVLVATDTAAAIVAKKAPATIPIVFTVASDPVQLGLVASISRPAGNATGVYVFSTELGPKRLQLLRELLPQPGVIAVLFGPSSSSTPGQLREVEAGAMAMAQPILVLHAQDESEVEKAFATMTERQVRGLLYGQSTYFQVIADKLVALAAHHRIPALYEWREFVEAGGLISYNSNRSEFARLAGDYVARILKGTTPADLPVVQSARFELVINLKTAKALGLTVPQSLLVRADEVIE